LKKGKICDVEMTIHSDVAIFLNRTHEPLQLQVNVTQVDSHQCVDAAVRQMSVEDTVMTAQVI